MNKLDEPTLVVDDPGHGVVFLAANVREQMCNQSDDRSDEAAGRTALVSSTDDQMIHSEEVRERRW